MIDAPKSIIIYWNQLLSGESKKWEFVILLEK